MADTVTQAIPANEEQPDSHPDDSANPNSSPDDAKSPVNASTPEPTAEAPADDAAAQPPMTKSALKRQRRQELYEAQKIARRAREKEKKKTKAAEKRKLIEEGVIEKPEPKKRKKGNSDSDGRKVEHGARVVLDVGFDELMNEKEIKSMSSQVAYCYAANRNATNPFPLLVSSFNGRLKESYSKRKDHLSWKGVEWWEDGFEKLYEGGVETAHRVAEPRSGGGDDDATPSEGASEKVEETEKVKLGVYAGRPRSAAPKSSLIYLTGDSPNVLTAIEPDHTYILGGIVDRNRYKFLCLNKAKELGIQHAQLPIGQYLPEMATRKVLTVNQVYEIMVNWVESLREEKERLKAEGKSEEEIAKAEGDWREALRKVMPERKFDKDGKAKKRAEKRAEKQKQDEGSQGVYVVEVDDDTDDDEDEPDEGEEPPVVERDAEAIDAAQS
ncbi:hypothetical protein JCM3766R1_002040 [Sporobolomyces carnicolor]